VKNYALFTTVVEYTVVASILAYVGQPRLPSTSSTPQPNRERLRMIAKATAKLLNAFIGTPGKFALVLAVSAILYYSQQTL